MLPKYLVIHRKTAAPISLNFVLKVNDVSTNNFYSEYFLAGNICMSCWNTFHTYIYLMLQITYILDSFIELVPAVTKKSSDHYVVLKKVRDMWLSLDNTEVKKANLSGMFRVNLAFYRNINTSKCVDYNIDFVAIKQGRARRRPPLLVKSHPQYSGQNDKGKKSSTQPQLSIPDDPFKELVGEGPILQNEALQGEQDISNRKLVTPLAQMRMLQFH